MSSVQFASLPIFALLSMLLSFEVQDKTQVQLTQLRKARRAFSLLTPSSQQLKRARITSPHAYSDYINDLLEPPLPQYLRLVQHLMNHFEYVVVSQCPMQYSISSTLHCPHSPASQLQKQVSGSIG